MFKKFPENFLWGAATSAHQVEGGNFNDWIPWEKENARRLAQKAKTYWQPWQQEKFPEMFNEQNYISGKACDHYNRFEEDFNLAQSGGHNAHRFSVEWSRIEPEEGKFSGKEIEHYRKVISALRERGLEPFVTLWHWTLPLWLRDKGGWKSKATIKHFLRYVEKIVTEFPEVNFWIVLNEPTVYASLGCIKGSQPPGNKNPFRARKVIANLVRAHQRAYDLIHKINDEAKVSTAYSVNYWIPHKNFFWNQMLSLFMNYLEGKFFKNIEKKADFIALQYYRSITIGFKLGGNFLGIVDNRFRSSENYTDLGWNIYPQGIYYFLKKIYRSLPIYITENGIANAGDGKREKFIKNHLLWVHKAISEGVDVRGYFHWSLLDNFEFVEIRGFWSRFGLVEIDYQTLERKPRKSFYYYKKIIEQNGVVFKDSPLH